MIGIIGAMEVEVAALRAQLKNTKTETVSGIEFACGELEGHSVVIARCGIGKVFAAMCAQTMILRYSPDCVINTGVAGTLCSDLSIGDIAVASTVVQYDMDTSPLGDPVGLLSGINIIHLPADQVLIDTAKGVLDEQGVHYCVGTIATGDRFMSDPICKAELHNDFGAIACEMEGGAIGHVCYVNRVPFLVLRAISDGADEQSNMDYPTFVKMAAKRSSNVLQQLVCRL